MINTSNRRKLLLAFTAAISMPVTVATEAVAQSAPPDNLPVAIMCYAQADQSWRIGYLFRVTKDGDAIYISPDGRLTTTVSAKGVMAAPANRPAGIDCYGKTLDELRMSGRTMEFRTK